MKLSTFFYRYKFYIISSICLLLWLLFFDRSNLIKQAEMYFMLRDINSEILYYEDEIKKLEKEEKDLLGSEAALEKYAREKYFLKKEGETVFVLVDGDDKVITE
ncbi:Septum formation initiator [Leadbetterella byssophila DSM 17132]|jgi:cell division protein DivIC|uniref:Septum formation initiator n=1 Tax=Leadbetterella byssophila (strain DSM 17132 / JCM 16389 / KACC 11308 / NBRC 106382 / 4M15) TaxID=649349 RepID=E4RY48_LEAB4|nr:septum formation initiator family protein [Leadbetterella byssophila]ADQ16376.1 Septum formation initiator [Leadbetterella byssophila DSM 17132]